MNPPPLGYGRRPKPPMIRFWLLIALVIFGGGGLLVDVLCGPSRRMIKPSTAPATSRSAAASIG